VRITEKFRTSRDSLIEKLKSNYGVETQTGSFSLRKIQYFNGARFTSRKRRPVCDILHDETLALPMYRGLSESDQTYIVRALEDLYENP
jgi:dTDP-4-amino-4,6-dideoxygalactose transaminase